MRAQRSSLKSAAMLCLGTSLVSLAIVAVLVNAAFYSSLADYWPVARFLGPAVFAGAILMAASFILGLVLHGFVVASRRREATPRTQAVPAQRDVRRVA